MLVALSWAAAIAGRARAAARAARMDCFTARCSLGRLPAILPGGGRLFDGTDAPGDDVFVEGQARFGRGAVGVFRRALLRCPRADAIRAHQREALDGERQRRVLAP